MGIKALKNNQEILSFSFNSISWNELKKNKEFKIKLTMPCCDTQAIMKTSHLGLQYFAHKKRGDCDSSSESMEHLLSKQIAYKVAIKAGWKASIEETLYLDDTDKVIADILLEKNGCKLALEFQFSSQSISKMKDRTQKYIQLGIPVVWINGFENTTYNYSIENFNSHCQLYKVTTTKLNSKIYIYYNDLTLKEFIYKKLKETELALPPENIDIKDLIYKDKDNCIRVILQDTLEDGTFVLIKQTWILGGKNVFLAEDQNNKESHLFQGLYTKGFKTNIFEYLLRFDDIN